MKINKIQIKNINKKLIALGLTFALIPTAFAGCTTISDIEHVTNEQGYIEGISGTISRDFLKKCNFHKVRNEITGEEYYTILVYDNADLCYYDVFTKQKMNLNAFSYSGSINSVEEYLTAYNMLKSEYTADEIEDLLNKFVENQNGEKNKQLIKE